MMTAVYSNIINVKFYNLSKNVCDKVTDIMKKGDYN